MSLNLKVAIAFLFFTGLCWCQAYGREPAPDSALAVSQADMAILPIANYSGKMEAHTVLLPRLHENLTKLGVSYVTSDELRPFLRKSRIRSRGWVGKAAARTIAEKTGIKHLLLGSWDVFRTEADPEIGLSLRILELENMALVASVSVGAAGSDFGGALGLGRVTSVADLADRVMPQAIDRLIPIPEYKVSESAYVGCYQIALIPLDNHSDTPRAGDIMTNIIISGLISEGYFVVEPGFIRELGLALGVITRGGVDRESALAIKKNFETCRAIVVTGAVEKFSTARGQPDMTVPSLAFGMRVMSPEDGNIYMMEELKGSGDDGEWFFQSGRIHALVPLANKVLKKFLKEFNKNNREEILYGKHRR
jgi:hypothetical protein